MSASEGKVCIITGASSGIGEATAIALSKRGATVVLAARRIDRLKELAERISSDGGNALPVACDVAQRHQVKQLIDQTRETCGLIDVLINNAGIMPLALMAKTRLDDWDAMIDINIKGLLYATGFALPVMLEQKTGHIINISSVAGRKTFPTAAVYCGTKHAVHAITEILREELATSAKDDGNRIRITNIAPGVVRTELADSILDEETREQWVPYLKSLGAPLESEDIANAIVFAIESPDHVNINEVLVRPVEQLR